MTVREEFPSVLTMKLWQEIRISAKSFEVAMPLSEKGISLDETEAWTATKFPIMEVCSGRSKRGNNQQNHEERQ